MLNKLLADKYKDDVNTKDIDKEVEKEQKQYGGKDQFESMLKQQKMSIGDYKVSFVFTSSLYLSASNLFNMIENDVLAICSSPILFITSSTVTASALLLGACGNSATDSKEDTIISSKAGDVKVEDVMNKI
jgi:hypothetical protein